MMHRKARCQTSGSVNLAIGMADLCGGSYPTNAAGCWRFRVGRNCIPATPLTEGGDASKSFLSGTLAATCRSTVTEGSEHGSYPDKIGKALVRGDRRDGRASTPRSS